MSSSDPLIPEPKVSDAKFAANRLNALKSTGPKTEEGKAIVSQNNVRHGLTGSFSVLSWESAGDYEALRQALHNEHQPATPTEELLVERLAQHHWLAQRAITLQSRCLDSENPERSLALYLRYQTSNERAFHKCLNEFSKLKQERQKEEQRRREQQEKEEQQAKKQEREERWRAEGRAYEEAERQWRRQLALNRKKAKSQPAPTDSRLLTA